MDLDAYLKNLESDLNRRQEDLKRSLGKINTNDFPLSSEPEISSISSMDTQFCPYCGNRIEAGAAFCPFCGTKLDEDETDDEQLSDDSHCSSVSLEHYEELEDDSKTKIATFEALANNMEEALPTFGFGDRDYAHYVALLSAVVELECNVSIYALQRQLHHNCNTNLPSRNGGEILLKKPHLTLRELSFNIRNDDTLERVEEINPRCLADNLDMIANTRNPGMHGNVVSKLDFDSFFSEFILFYNTYLPQLFKLKKNLQQSQRKYSPIRYSNQREVPVVDIDFSEVDMYLSSLRGVLGEGAAEGDEDLLSQPVASGAFIENCSGIRKGLILTNSDRLTSKYTGESYDNVMAFLNAYINISHMGGNDYILIDMASSEMSSFINKDFTWQNHLLALDSVANKYGISPENPWALFIVGGDDVIPMPTVESPFGPNSRQEKVDLAEADVDTDVPYAYRSCDIKILENGLLSFDTLLHYTIGPRFIVGRLPMESGQMETSLENDLGLYINKMAVEFVRMDESGNVPDDAETGYDLDTCATTVAARFQSNGKVVVQTLSLPADEDVDGLRSDGMYMSPAIDTENEELCKYYVSELADKDMFVFVTHSGHGNDDICASFLGDDGATSHPLTLRPMMMPQMQAKAIVPVCCWGGRYKNYRRTRSMVLMSMYHSSVLTYLGSSRSAHAAMNGYLHNADAIVTFFADYLMQGLNSGEALTRSRYNLLHSLPDMRVAPSALLTFLEFNLFGDPLLYGRATRARRDMAEVVRGGSSATDIPFVDDVFGQYSVEYTKEKGYCGDSDSSGTSSFSILGRVRSLVNRNLQQMRDVVNRELYSLYGVEPRHLSQIFSYPTASGETEYVFCYSNSDCKGLRLDTFAYVTHDGTIWGVEQSY